MLAPPPLTTPLQSDWTLRASSVAAENVAAGVSGAPSGCGFRFALSVLQPQHLCGVEGRRL